MTGVVRGAPASHDLALTLDAAPDRASTDAARLEVLSGSLEEVGGTLKRLVGDLGVAGPSADLARESVARLAAAVLDAADAATLLGGTAARAAGALVRARTDYEALPPGSLTVAERHRLVESGAGPGVSSIEAALAAERERAAAAALARVDAAMDAATGRIRATGGDDAGPADPARDGPQNPPRGTSPAEPRRGPRHVPDPPSPAPEHGPRPAPIGTTPLPHPPDPGPGEPPVTFGLEPPAPVFGVDPPVRPSPLDLAQPLVPLPGLPARPDVERLLSTRLDETGIAPAWRWRPEP